MKQKFFITLLIIISSLAFIGAGCKPETLKGDLTFWGVFDDSDAFEPLIKDFKALHPQVKISYRKKTIDEYEKDLVNALAEGRGPDMFMIHHTWVARHSAKLATIPSELMGVKEYHDTFVDVATEDFVAENGIYSFPLYIDTLALFYNKDVFNNTGITRPPITWEEFQDDVEKLTERDEFSNITEAGAAIGTAKNINRSPDILAALMLQKGAEMVDEGGKASFSNDLGQDALRFYTQFADRKKTAYTWNPTLHYSIDAFSERTVAMMFNYSYQYNTLKAKDPRFNFKVAPFPQIDSENKINYANYWSPVVSASSANQKAAWTFLKFISEKENAERYLAATKKPPARRDLVDAQKNDPDMGVFAEQALTARSWYRFDSAAIDKIFVDAIEDVVAGKSSVGKALSEAQNKVNLFMEEE